MKRIFLIMAAFAMLTSCKKKTGEGELATVPENLPQDISLTVNGTDRVNTPLYPWSENYNYLGFGYDVTDKFEDEASIRASVVDISAYDAANPYNVNSGKSTQGSWHVIEAENAEDLSDAFSNKIEQTEGLKVFGNTIKDAFPETATGDEKYVYGYYSNYWINKFYKCYYNQNATNFLTQDFKADIISLSAKDLVAKYGTHVLSRIKTGSTFDVFYQAEAPDGDRKYMVREGLRYALLKTFGLMSGFLDDVNLKVLNANKNVRIYYKSIGGDASRLNPKIINNRVFVNISDWRSTTTFDNSRFIGTLDNGLVTLDTFIDDNTKKNEVKLYIQQYLAQKAVKPAR